MYKGKKVEKTKAPRMVSPESKRAKLRVLSLSLSGCYLTLVAFSVRVSLTLL